LLYPDNILLFDMTEIGTGIDPAFSRQYVCGYGVAGGTLNQTKLSYYRYRPMAADINYIPAGDPKCNEETIDPGPNKETTAPGAISDSSVGNIRWRHGKNDQANFLFADGTVRTMGISKPIPGQAGKFKGDVTYSLWRLKVPQGFKQTG